MNKRAVLLLGVINPLLFWATLFGCGLMLENYDHLRDLVSGPGALGKPSQHLFSAGLTLCSALNLVYAARLVRLCREKGLSVWPAVLLAFFSALAGPALVPMPLPLHGVIGLPMLLFFLSPPAGLLLWKRKLPEPGIAAVALISTAFVLLGFLVCFPGILTDFFGLKQRFVYLGWSVWSAGLASVFLKLETLG